MTSRLHIFKKYPTTEKICKLCFHKPLSKSEISNEIYGYWNRNGIEKNVERLFNNHYLTFNRTGGGIKKWGKYRTTIKPFFDFMRFKKQTIFTEEEKEIIRRIFELEYARIKANIVNKENFVDGIIEVLLNSLGIRLRPSDYQSYMNAFLVIPFDMEDFIPIKRDKNITDDMSRISIIERSHEFFQGKKETFDDRLIKYFFKKYGKRKLKIYDSLFSEPVLIDKYNFKKYRELILYTLYSINLPLELTKKLLFLLPKELRNSLILIAREKLQS
jgi:hypothetical protein